jgi:hypothetical protein
MRGWRLGRPGLRPRWVAQVDGVVDDLEAIKPVNIDRHTGSLNKTHDLRRPTSAQSGDVDDGTSMSNGAPFPARLLNERVRLDHTIGKRLTLTDGVAEVGVVRHINRHTGGVVEGWRARGNEDVASSCLQRAIGIVHASQEGVVAKRPVAKPVGLKPEAPVGPCLDAC